MPIWAPRAIGTIRTCLQVLLVVVFAYLVARIIWLLVAPGPAVSPLTARALPVPMQDASSSKVRADLGVLAASNPFKPAGEMAETVPDAPQTQLNLRLVALFTSTDGESGSATIITPDNQATRFELGDTVLPGVRLERILSDRVIISQDGREETLMRSGREAGLTVISEPGDAPDETREMTQEEVRSFSPGVTAQTLLAGLDAVPEEQNGEVTALRLRPRGSASLMQSAGIEPGDRLVAVNGTRVASVDTAALMDQLTGARTVRLTIERAGQERSIDIRFEVG